VLSFAPDSAICSEHVPYNETRIVDKKALKSLNRPIISGNKAHNHTYTDTHTHTHTHT